MVNQKIKLTKQENFSRVGDLIVGMILLIVLSSSCSLNGFINLSDKTPPVSETSTTQPTFTSLPSQTPTIRPSSTPKPTATPEVKYSCPKSPDSINIQELSLKDDIQSGKLAKWVLSLPESKVKISNKPSSLNLRVGHPSDNSTNLSASSNDIPGWAEKFTKYIGMCEIDPKEFGLVGKNDAFLVITVAQDKNNTRVPQFTLASREEASKLYYGYLQDPNNGIDVTSNLGDGMNIDLIAKGAKPQGPDDLRQLGNGEFLFSAQGKDVKDINVMLNEIADTEMFSPSAQETFRTTVFLTSTYRDLKPNEP